MGNPKMLPSVTCKQPTSNAHLLLVACFKVVRSGDNHVKGLHAINQRRVHIVVEVQAGSLAASKAETCHLLRVLFGNSGLQTNTKRRLHIGNNPSCMATETFCIAAHTLESMGSTHLKAQCSTIQGIK